MNTRWLKRTSSVPIETRSRQRAFFILWHGSKRIITLCRFFGVSADIGSDRAIFSDLYKFSADGFVKCLCSVPNWFLLQKLRVRTEILEYAWLSKRTNSTGHASWKSSCFPGLDATTRFIRRFVTISAYRAHGSKTSIPSNKGNFHVHNVQHHRDWRYVSRGIKVQLDYSKRLMDMVSNL